MQFPIEHVAWQVPEPTAAAKWYVEHLGFRILRHDPADPNQTHFMADSAGRCVIEIYRNPAAPIPDYRQMHPLQLHLAFAVEDPAAARDALVAAGCMIASDLTTTAAGDQLCMLRDPFGFAIQLCRRARPML